MEPAVQTLVAAWFAGDHCLFEACTEQPEHAWGAVLAILHHDLSPDDLSLLAAGPLEIILGTDGAAFIDRVEARGASDPRFNHLLGGVWQGGMTEEVWLRVQAVRNEVW